MKSKFGLKKKVISALTSEQQSEIKGQGTTSFKRCSVGFICCGKRTKGSFAYCDDGPGVPPSIPEDQ